MPTGDEFLASGPASESGSDWDMSLNDERWEQILLGEEPSPEVLAQQCADFLRVPIQRRAVSDLLGWDLEPPSANIDKSTNTVPTAAQYDLPTPGRHGFVLDVGGGHNLVVGLNPSWMQL